MLILVKFKTLAKRTVMVFFSHTHTPISHKSQHVPITPKMVHMVTNKHNFKSHSKVDRLLAMKTTRGEQS